MDEERNYWNEQSRIYDSLEYKPSEKYYRWQPARWAGNNVAIRTINKYLKDIKSSCEIGAGSGAFSIALYNHNNTIKLTAVDKSLTATNYGKKIFKDLNIPVNYINEDLFNVNGKYDLVLSLGVIEHYEEEVMEKFVKKCIDLSNKYILIAIPNQDSIFFKNYVEWTRKNSKEYEEDHKKFDTEDLINLLRKMNLDIECVDGFQMFLSNHDFLSENSKKNLDIINILKEKLNKYDPSLSNRFPYVDFNLEDIENMTLAELDVDDKTRMKYSFMTFVLAKIKE